MELESLPAAFVSRSRIDESSGCWVWTGSRTTKGYARFAGNFAHRTAYQMLVGPIPEGLVIDHLCRNRGCINPAHMEPVTNRENVMRGNAAQVARARTARITHCPRGHEYSEKNVYRSPSSPNKRRCRECARLREKSRPTRGYG